MIRDREDGEDPRVKTKTKRLRNQNRGRSQRKATELRQDNVLDQFYTKRSVIEDVVIPAIIRYAGARGVFVDFSCGENLLGHALATRGFQVISYDLKPTPEATESGALTKDWFDVKELPQNAYVGLNPPFGYRGNLAQEFIAHTLSIGKPLAMFLILPIRQWKTPGYEEVEKIKLPLEAFVYPNGEGFSYPCHLYVFKPCASIDIKAVSNDAPRLPSTFLLRTHPKTIDLTRCALLVRRVGFYAGRQFYFVVDHNVYYYHKKELQKGICWEKNNHNIDNAFWVVYFPLGCTVTVEELVQVADNVTRKMDEDAVTTRQEDVKRALSINRGQLSAMLCASLPDKFLQNK